MPELRIGSLFSGYGGLDLATEAFFGAETAWHVEFDKAPSKILAHRWPGVPNHGDVTTVDWSQVEPVDILTGGFPCQDLSLAGRRQGMRPGTRSGLWADYVRAIDALNPGVVVIENVRGLLSGCAESDLGPCAGCVGDGDHRPVLRALGRVLGDLADLGFDAEWAGIRASDVGAPHGRFRVFVLAYRHDLGRQWSGIERRGLGRPADGGVAPVTQLLPTTTAARRVRVRGGSTPSDVTLTDAVTGRRGLLLPTPQVADATGGHATRSGARSDELLLPGAAVAMLPTPRAGAQGKSARAMTASKNNGRRSGGGQSSPPGLEETALLAAGVRPQHLPADEDLPPIARATVEAMLGSGPSEGISWGPYGPAVTRWESITRPAPSPTLADGKGGQARLNAGFAEWMMGVPAGWITDPAIGLTRREQLKACGNGVVPQQAHAALDGLWARATEAVAA